MELFRTPPPSAVLLTIALVFGTAPLTIAQFFPLPGLPPPPPLFVFPEFTLQVANTGGLKAFLPDLCGVESVKFDWRKSGVGDWNGGFLPPPVGGIWAFEDPGAGLGIGDPIFYRATLLFNGQSFEQPETPFTVTDLVETFSPPSPPPPSKLCEKPTTPSTTTKKTTTKKTTTTTTTEESTRPTEDTTDPDEESSTKAEEESKKKKPPKEKEEEEDPTDDRLGEDKKPSKELDEEWGGSSPPSLPPGVCNSPWFLEPMPGDSKVVQLEKQLAKMRCDMNRFANLSQAMYQELNDLKKLNYAMVARMQRLESILRSSPFPSPPFLG